MHKVQNHLKFAKKLRRLWVPLKEFFFFKYIYFAKKEDQSRFTALLQDILFNTLSVTYAYERIYYDPTKQTVFNAKVMGLPFKNS